MNYSDNIMLDLETQSTRSNANILTIGAIKFKNNDQQLPDINEMDTFYRRINLDSAKLYGLDISEDTMKWWDEQKEEEKYEAFTNPDRIPLKQALLELNKWIGDFKYTKMYAHSPDFDLTILREAYIRCDMKEYIPFNFWMARCTRTVYDLGSVRLKDYNNENHHNALSDCYTQIKALKDSMENIKKNNVN